MTFLTFLVALLIQVKLSQTFQKGKSLKKRPKSQINPEIGQNRLFPNVLKVQFCVKVKIFDTI